MNIKLDTMLIPDVSPRQYDKLSNQRAEIISEAMSKFNDVWRKKVKGIKSDFKYNNERDIVGIYIGDTDKTNLVIMDSDLTVEQSAVAYNLKSVLEEKLFFIKLHEEKWI
jgi:hypothetical protein